MKYRGYSAAGEKWDVELSKEKPVNGVRTLIFYCVSNSSNGWRIAEVPASRFSAADVDKISAEELDEFFESSQPFDFTHDPKAVEWTVGEGGVR